MGLRRVMAERMRRRVAERAEAGPWRWHVKDWSRPSGLALAKRVLAAPGFDGPPRVVDVDGLRRVCVVAPHADDEVIGAGGLLSLAAGAGASLDVVVFTDGAELGGDRDASRRRRRAEAEGVAGELGAGLSWVGVDNVGLGVGADDVARLGAQVAAAEPDVVLLPWLLDLPASHRLCVLAAFLALRERPLDCEVWSYEVHNTVAANVVVDVTEAIDAKRDLIVRYASQLATGGRRYDHLAIGRAATNARHLPPGPGERYAELFHVTTLADWLEMVRSSYFVDLADTFRGDERVITAAEGMLAEVSGS